MLLCVGAASRRVVEEAAKLKVHQVVASRRQVDVGGGYIGMDQEEFASVVKSLSHGATQVVRDHGGPLQGGTDDDGTASFDADVVAGFDALHIDVSALPTEDQPLALVNLLKRYRTECDVEIGGERDEQAWLNTLLLTACGVDGVRPTYCVLDAGGHIWADRQRGALRPPDELRTAVNAIHMLEVKAKIHNADWAGNRHCLGNVVDAYNVAPEFGQVEVDALLTVLPFEFADRLLEYAYSSMKWERWFTKDEGTWFDRAKCAVRYLLEDPRAQGLAKLDEVQEIYVRGRIRDAIVRG